MDRKRFYFIAAAILIALFSLIVSHSLVSELSNEERDKVRIWSEALNVVSNADDDTDLTLVLSVLNSNRTIPVMVFGSDSVVQTYRNISIDVADSLASLAKKAAIFRKYKDRHIRIELDASHKVVAENNFVDVYYDDSLLLKKLAYYPFIQLTVVIIFMCIAIFALLSSKKSEQNKVWVGLSKETAHQLGTPISSLMAWIDILSSKYPTDDLLPEMNKDVTRLQMIANRFSKIGSLPKPEPHQLKGVIEAATAYVSRRVSNKVVFKLNYPDEDVMVWLNVPLFSWVVENLCKNAIDAMDGQGTISVDVLTDDHKVYIDFSDTGKGMAKSNYKSVFKPGFTTKKRGWGLGLSLAKRIIEEYHQGKIYVKRSEVNNGTTFRIELKC
ncbi:MAG: HAMP domain-containing sensor histidine kinase [Bacteroidaceae bacterium]